MFTHYRMVEWKDSFETTVGSIATLIRFGYLCIRVSVNQVMWRAENSTGCLKSWVTQRGAAGGSGAATPLAAES
jgi:hypothetical protein